MIFSCSRTADLRTVSQPLLFLPAAVGADVGGALGAVRPAAAAPPRRGVSGEADPAEDQTAGGGQRSLHRSDDG